MSDEEAFELQAQSEAAIKLAMNAMEFMQNLASSMGLNLDFAGAAYALLNNPAVDDVERGTFLLEKRSREIAAEALMILARGFGQS